MARYPRVSSQEEEETINQDDNQEIQPAEPAAFSKKIGSTPFVIILVVIALAAGIGFAWSFNKYLTMKNQVATLGGQQAQNQLSKKEIADLVAKVGKLIILPKDEEPTVATVLDAAGLAKDQPFYKDAHNGDKVLIYVKAQKALIYDEKENKLVNVGPVYIENKQAAAVNPITVEIRNGSKETGAANDLKTALAGNKAVAVLKVGTASQDDYTGVTLINLKNKDVSALAQSLGAKVVTAMPAGEAASTADVVVIVGNR